MQKIVDIFRLYTHRIVPVLFLVFAVFGGICIGVGFQSKISFSNSNDNMTLKILMDETHLNFFQIYDQFKNLDDFSNNYSNLNLSVGFLEQFGTLKDLVMTGFILMVIACPLFLATVLIYFMKTPIYIRRFKENRKLVD